MVLMRRQTALQEARKLDKVARLKEENRIRRELILATKTNKPMLQLRANTSQAHRRRSPVAHSAEAKSATAPSAHPPGFHFLADTPDFADLDDEDFDNEFNVVDHEPLDSSVAKPPSATKEVNAFDFGAGGDRTRQPHEGAPTSTQQFEADHRYTSEVSSSAFLTQQHAT